MGASMLLPLIRRIISTRNNRIVKRFQRIVDRINRLEESVVNLTDDALRNKTSEFKIRFASGTSLDDMLPEAFAVVREATKRVLGTRHFDVQLIGGIVLHNCMVAEMRTGEGKTQVAALAAYLNALAGRGVHVVTVNDYLAGRDSQWMGQVYRYLGLSVGCIKGDTSEDARKAAYDADITYGTNNELGFDFLRDNLKYDISTIVQRQPHYAIIDEADSVLIDEARTPLIISGPADDDLSLYRKIDKIVRYLQPEYFLVDEKQRSVILTDAGNDQIDQILVHAGLIADGTSIYDIENVIIVHHLTQALRAHHLYKRDVAYLVKDGKLLIVDEFTGRIMEGRRYSEGLHQALEAKEEIDILSENQTIASITFQNYFRMYPRLAGMTGTAATEATELGEIYKLDVVTVPTNLPMVRNDMDDIIYKTAGEKYKALIDTIMTSHAKGQPMLVGTVSVEKSELLSSMLKKQCVPHNVLNAKYHEQEAKIIAQAGRPGAITIATNMAGRGTDIMLGGNVDMLFCTLLDDPNFLMDNKCMVDVRNGKTCGLGSEYNKHLKVKSTELRDIALLVKREKDDVQEGQLLQKLRSRVEERVKEDRDFVRHVGGLLVIGTERHESRRIDNQLRGRAGRQGDEGASVFFLSLEDDLMRIFGSEKLGNFLTKLGLKEGEAIVHPWISKSLCKAQQRVEMNNYEIRKNLLQFDDVMNEQRKVVYSQRSRIMNQPGDLIDSIRKMVVNTSAKLVARFTSPKIYKEEWDIAGLEQAMFVLYGIRHNVHDFITQDGVGTEELHTMLNQMGEEVVIGRKLRAIGMNEGVFLSVVQNVFLMTLDQLWKDHLHGLDHLRSGIGLRAYGQKDPLMEYKFEAFEMFRMMLSEFEEQVLVRLAHVHIAEEWDGDENVDDGDCCMSSGKDGHGVSKRTTRKRAHSAYGSAEKMRFLHCSEENAGDTGHRHVRQGGASQGNNVEFRDTDEMLAEPSCGVMLEKKRIGRNQACPCGSGKKYKHCHGAIR